MPKPQPNVSKIKKTIAASTIPPGFHISKSGTLVSYGEEEDVTDIVIPENVVRIGERAFRNCIHLTSVVIPEGVIGIGYEAFRNCIQLKSVTIPNSMVTLSDTAFAGCENLTEIHLPERLEKIGYTIRTVRNNHHASGKMLDVAMLFPEEIRKDFRISSNLTLNGYTGSAADVVIPDGVLRIGTYAFRNCYQIRSVTIPDSVTEIGDLAFRNCTNLTSIVIPDSVTKLSKSAFSGCKNLKLPQALIDAGYSAGLDGYSKGNVVAKSTAVVIPEEYRKIFTVSQKGKLTAYHGNSGTTEIEIPEGVTEIGTKVFLQCTNLKSVIIPKTVKKIGSCAFQDCINLSNVVIPEGVVQIFSFAFENCPNLTEITIPDSVVYLDARAFKECVNLAAIRLPEHLKTAAFLEKMEGIRNPYVILEAYRKIFTIDQKGKLTGFKKNIEIPEGVTEIGARVFQHTDLKSIIIPETVKKIGQCAFRDNVKLTEITIPNSVTVIAAGAFQECSSLKHVTLPTGIHVIENSLFRDCEKLTEIVIPEGVIEIKAQAFSGCKNLASVTIPNSVTNIGENAFWNCENLANIIVPDDASVKLKRAIFTQIYCASWEYRQYKEEIDSMLEYGNFSVQMDEDLKNPIIFRYGLVVGDPSAVSYINQNFSSFEKYFKKY